MSDVNNTAVFILERAFRDIDQMLKTGKLTESQLIGIRMKAQMIVGKVLTRSIASEHLN